MTSATTDMIGGLGGNLALKAPVKVVATAAITLSGEQTVSGTAVVAGDRVLTIDQANAVDNGIWVVSTGTWARATDFDGSRDVVQGTLVPTADGTAVYRLTTASPVVGTSTLSFTRWFGSTADATVEYSTVAAVEAADIPASVGAVRTQGYAEAGDGGGGLYAVSASEPSHSGKIQSADGAWWELQPETGGGWNALALGVTVGDVITYEAANTDILNSILAVMTSGQVIRLPAGTVRVDDTLDIEDFSGIVGQGNHGGSTIKSNALAGPVLQLLGRSINLSGFRIDATAARKAALSVTGDGILITDGDVAHVSQSRIYFDKVSIANQPRHGIRSMGSLTSSDWRGVEAESNIGAGLYFDDGTGQGYSNLQTASPGLLTVLHFRGIGNGGPAIQVGTRGQTTTPARVTIEQSDSFDNGWNYNYAPMLRPAAALAASPIATTNLSNVIVVTQPAHPAHHGNFVKLAGCVDVGGITAAQLNKVHQVKAWLTDTTFSIELAAGSATSTTTGGGASCTAEHKACCNFFLSGESHTIMSNGVGSPFYDQVTDIFGATKTALQHPPGGMFFYAASSPKLLNNRYIDTAYFWMGDMEGTPSGAQATSLTQHLYEDAPRAVQANAPDAPYGFIVPRNCNAFINTGNQSAATTLIWNRDTASRFMIEGQLSYGVNNVGSTWRLDSFGALSTYTIASGSLSVGAAIFLIAGQGAAADDLDNIFDIGGGVLPAGFAVEVVNDKAYAINIRHLGGGTGNIKTMLGGNALFRSGTSRRFVSDGTYMYDQGPLIGAKLGASVAYQITSGVITITGPGYIKVIAEGGAADLLDTINGGQDGDVLIIKSSNSSNDITYKDGTGNMLLAGDCTLLQQQDRLMLIYDAGLSSWCEISRSINT